MIPFFQINVILLGPIVIQAWGLMVSLGILTGLILASFRAKKLFLSYNLVYDLGLWGIIGGIIGGRLGFVFFYDFGYFWKKPIEILYLWQGGASSLGGFIGAALAIYLLVKIKHLALKELLPYLDVLSLSLWLGWAIGRIGCFLIHDHPGMLSNSWLAVQYPGGSRFDLGLTDSILGLALFIVFSILFKRLIKIRWGLVTFYSWTAYAFVRFWLDFLRATDLPGSDARYLYLTPAQWGMGLVVLGLTFWGVYSKMRLQKKNGRVA